MSMHRLRGIHLLFTYLACALLCAATVYVFFPWIQSALFKDFARDRQNTVCRIVAGELHSTLERARLLLKSEANAPDMIKAVQESRDTEVLSQRFGELSRFFEGMDAFVLAPAASPALCETGFFLASG